MIKILSIGDLHGRDVWELFADLKILTETPQLDTEYDKYIFIGDYTDSFVKTNVEIIHNLKRLIQLKENYPDKVVLLLGNHDLQYLNGYARHGCSGFRSEAFFDLNELLRSKRDLFQAAYQEGSIVWTHAGIHRGWYQYEFPYTSVKIADDLNGAFLQNVDCMFDCGFKRGGNKNQGGPFWADKHETSTKPLKGISQVIGHTPVDKITIINDIQKDKDHFLAYIDCTEGDTASVLELTIGQYMTAHNIITKETPRYLDTIESLYDV